MIRDRITRLARAAVNVPAWSVIKRRARDVSQSEDWTPEDEARVREGFWPKLRRHVGRLPFAEDLAAAWFAMTDLGTPHTARAILIGALAYFVMPADIIPDFLIGGGFLDDATVLGFALSAVQRHILPHHREQARIALGLPPAPLESTSTNA
jgi:uncharacterized membrane protein YkvA (DUF1232 family)